MKITDIKQQVKRTDRYSVFVEGKYLFSLGELELINAELRIGKEVDRSELQTLKQTAQEGKAYDQSLNLIARRSRSQWEMGMYLKRKGYDKALCQKIINRLLERHLLNDQAFAQAWVENRRLLKPTSKRKLILELRAKRVANEIIQEALELDETDERAVLQEIVERKQHRYPDRLKFMRYLASQGFNYDDIKAVLEEVKE